MQLSGEPRILVSLSSGWFPGQDKALQNILDALRSLQVRAVVTTSPAIRPDDLQVPVNAEVHSYLQMPSSRWSPAPYRPDNLAQEVQLREYLQA